MPTSWGPHAPGGRGHNWLEKPNVLDEGHGLAQEYILHTQPLHLAPGGLGLQQLLEIHLDVFGDSLAGYCGVPQLLEQEQDGGIKDVAVLLHWGLGGIMGWVLPPSGGPLEDSSAKLLWQ